MNGNVKFGLTPGRCLILCALSALIGCALFLFSASGAEATLALGWFPFTQLQGLTADADGLTPPGVCLAFAALPAAGFLLLLIRRCFRAEDLLLLVCAGLLYNVMRGKLSLEGLMAGEAAVQPAEFWTVLLAWAGLRPDAARPAPLRPGRRADGGRARRPAGAGKVLRRGAYGDAAALGGAGGAEYAAGLGGPGARLRELPCERAHLLLCRAARRAVCRGAQAPAGRKRHVYLGERP